jgi:polypyrimidine tract-binding protein 1
VLVSNLPDVKVSCDMLFTLFGAYGDVQRVKILYNKRDTALIQFISPQSAYLAALHLNHLQLYGRTISVTPSKHIEVSLPKSVQSGGTQADHEQQLSG